MKNITLYLFLCQCYLLSAQQVRYVNTASLGANTGTNWADAYTDIQAALNSANYGDQIWVATGVYFPTTGVDRNISFNIPLGVSLYGGFSGIETMLSERNTTINPTVLSGDIGIPDTNTDNSYHVVLIFGGDSLTILDGFTITRGQAGTSSDPFPVEYGGGVLVLADVNNPIANPIIRFCRFEQNRARSGGAIACVAKDEYRCIPQISHCFFTRNRGENYGGSIYKVGRNAEGKPFRFYNCVFEDNYCFNYAGGVAVINPSGVVQFQKCTFIRDSSRIESGGVYVQTDDYNVRYELDSCDFTANYSFINSGGFSHFNSGFLADSVELIVKNCNFLLNKTFSNSGTGVSSYLGGLVKYHYVFIQDSWFESNITPNGGSGILIEGTGGAFFDVNIDRCYFLGNQVLGGEGSASFYYRSVSVNGDKNRNTITNSVFAYNDGAVTSLAGNPGTTDTRVVNCTFYRNNKVPFTKYWDADFNTTDYYMNMQILNCVIWEPETLGPHTLFFNNDPFNYNVKNYLVEHSMVNYSDCIYDSVNPCEDGMEYAQWPEFIDSSGITFEVWGNSPAYNTGSNLVADTFGLLKDYLGKPRIANDTVDMGAYEIPGPINDVNDRPNDARHLTIHLSQNPTPAFLGVRAELFSIFPGEYFIRFIRVDGQIILEGTQFIPALSPTKIEFRDRKITPGMYVISIMDKYGHATSAKVLVTE